MEIMIISRIIACFLISKPTSGLIFVGWIKARDTWLQNQASDKPAAAMSRYNVII